MPRTAATTISGASGPHPAHTLISPPSAAVITAAIAFPDIEVTFLAITPKDHDHQVSPMSRDINLLPMSREETPPGGWPRRYQKTGGGGRLGSIRASAG